MNITVDGVTRPMTNEEIFALQKAQQDFANDVKNGHVVLHNAEENNKS